MVVSWKWSGTNDACKVFERVDDISKLKLRLLQRGKPIAAWSPVSFYQLDHWMGTEEVTPVTTGRITAIQSAD